MTPKTNHIMQVAEYEKRQKVNKAKKGTLKMSLPEGFERKGQTIIKFFAWLQEEKQIYFVGMDGYHMKNRQFNALYREWLVALASDGKQLPTVPARKHRKKDL